MSKNVKMTNPMKVITGPNTRWSYANVWEPKSINGGTPKYSVSLIIPKSDTKTVAKIEAAIEAAYREGEAKLKGNGKSVPALSVLKTPLRDGDLERPDDPAYAGSYFVNANATSAPGIVDILEVEAGTTGYCGSDTGHGGRTYFRIQDAACTDMEIHSYTTRCGSNGFEVYLGGDCELETMIRALKFITKVLEDESKEVYD